MTEADARIAGLTPERLALLGARLRQQRSVSNRITRRGTDAHVPLSFAQQRLWFLDRLLPDSVHYNVHTALTLNGAVEASVLTRALEELVRRHEILRTTFHDGDSGPWQHVSPSACVDLARVDLRSLPAERRRWQLERTVAGEAARPFDLQRGPIFRAMLIELDGAESVLLLSMHHIATDAWSMPILRGELVALYDAYSRGATSPLPELPVQYGDFAIWQRQQLQGPRLESLVGAWRRALEGMPTRLELPFDRPRPAVQSYRGAIRYFVVPAAIAAAVKRVGQRCGATPFITFLAAFAVLLHRYAGQNDLGIGTPIANRSRTELETLIGFFTNTLVIRSRADGDPTFIDLLDRIRQGTLAAYEHQDLPFEKLVEELQPERSLSHNPLFQVLFTLEDAPGAQAPLASSDDEATGRITAKFDLTLFLRDTGETLVGGLEFNTDLFDAATIEQMAAHFRMLLAAVAADPEQPITRLSMVGDDERQRLLFEWNPAPQPIGGLPLVTERFERQVERTPAASAVLSPSGSLTYHELNEWANQVAADLRARGVGPESAVAICLSRSPALYAAVLGVLKAGAAYVPLDADDPQSRLDMILEDAGPALVITEDGFVNRFGGRPVMVIQRDHAASPYEHRGNPPRAVSAANLAYVIYTSGSTGRPKGVMMPHGPLANLVTWQLDQPCSAAITPQFAPFGFDVAFHEMFSTWGAGGALLVIGEADRRDSDRLAAILEADHVDRLFVPYVALNQLATLDDGSRPLALRQVHTAGEALHVNERIAAFFARLPGCTLCNQYGPSETHVVSEYVLDGSPLDWPALPPIGKPIANTTLYVLDGWMQPVPLGVAGELYIGGCMVGRGYLGRPDLTAERFIPDPFDAAPGQRLYRSGDLVRRRRDGHLEFLGRRDEQVKVRGYRVEPGEVEAVLRSHPLVREAAVVVQARSGVKHLAAFFIGDPALRAEELRPFLQHRLPGYMVPSSLTRLDALPLTSSGKVDRRVLAGYDAAPQRAAAAYVPPRSPIEEMVVEIWQEVLGVPRVGIQDNFFDIGGHSLSATQVVSRVRSRFDVVVPLRKLFEAPTVEAFIRAADLAVRQGREDLPAIAALPATLAAGEGIDELADEEVDRLLRLLVVGSEAAPADPVPSAAPSPVAAALPIANASEILERLDTLSDAEVDRLLASFIGGNDEVGEAHGH